LLSLFLASSGRFYPMHTAWGYQSAIQEPGKKEKERQ
jgi:hypothetical protein